MPRQRTQIPRVVIIGRPNVGKSSLFNRIIGKKKAVVDDVPGVTRDGVSEMVVWNGKTFELSDSAGVAFDDDFFAQRVISLVTRAIANADLLLFLVEPQITPLDTEVAELIRRSEKPYLSVVNKIDGPEKINDASVAYELGLEDILTVSAMSGLGTGDLLDEITKRLPKVNMNDLEKQISIAIVGRPNVGKSTLLNKILGEERVIVDDNPGTTRDAVDIHFTYFGRTINLVDTAGILRKQQDIQYYSSLRSKDALKRSDLVFLVIDYKQGFGRVEKSIANEAIRSYKGIAVLVNKWDLKEEKETNTAERLRQKYLNDVPFLKFAPFIFISAKTGKNIKRAIDTAIEIYDERDKRIPTPELNKFFRDMFEAMPSGRNTSFKYAAQSNTSPPEIVIFHKNKDKLPPSWKNRVINALRKTFGFKGVPIKLVVREAR